MDIMLANEFEASKHQRQIVNRFNHFIQDGDENMERDIASRKKATKNVDGASNSEGAAGPERMEDTPMNDEKQKPRKHPKNAPTDLKSRIHASELELNVDKLGWKHKFKVKLEPSSFSEEKHKLYAKYQESVHNDPPSKCGVSNFTNFLVDTPLTPTVKAAEWSEGNPGYGSFHQCYYLDDKLIAVSVIDILPECISAVYFYYDPDYSILSLGKYSAQREIALVQTLNLKRGYEDLKFYYMGFYIFTCQKMTYKGQFHPSFLLDPATYEWVDFKKCKDILGCQRYSCFVNPVQPNALFEAKIQSIIEKKKGMGIDGDNDSNEDDDEEDDEWASVDDSGAEEGQKHHLDPDQFNENALKGNRLVDENEDDVKTEENDASAEAAEKEKKKKMKRIFEEVTALPPPGCGDPNKVKQDDLENVLCLTGKNTLVPVTAAESYRNNKAVRNNIAEYFAMVGQELAAAMLVYIR
ncbi:Arginyl-tRNA--protein transferase 1 [Podila humilis]|nr:Arginyl-tRNA--protein transferase 1 [Podila humilis]